MFCVCLTPFNRVASGQCYKLGPFCLYPYLPVETSFPCTNSHIHDLHFNGSNLIFECPFSWPEPMPHSAHFFSFFVLKQNLPILWPFSRTLLTCKRVTEKKMEIKICSCIEGWLIREQKILRETLWRHTLAKESFEWWEFGISRLYIQLHMFALCMVSPGSQGYI